MVEVIEGKKHSYRGEDRQKKKEITAKHHSYATENSLRAKYDRACLESPGERSAIAGKFRKY